MSNKKTKSDATGKNQGPLKKKDIQQNPDNRIDQDFPGYPHAPGQERIIRPENATEKKNSDIDNKDGEKRKYNKRKNN